MSVVVAVVGVNVVVDVVRAVTIVVGDGYCSC